MRPLFATALLGATLSVVAVGQDSSEQQVQQSKKKHIPTAADALFENGPDRPNALAEARREEEEQKAKSQKPAEPSSPAPPPSAPPAPVVPTVQAVPPGPPQKDLTGDEFALIHPGATSKEVLKVLGPPSSRVVIPDDDGHLRETLQYWVNGKPTATVRLDDGRVVRIETKQR